LSQIGSDIDWKFIKDKYEYMLEIYLNSSECESFFSLPTFISYGALKSSKEENVVPYEFSSSFNSLGNQVASCTQVKIGEPDKKFANPARPSPSPQFQDLNSSCNFESDLISGIISS